MEDEIYATLLRYHREVFMPDLERIVDAVEAKADVRWDITLGHFDALYKRFDRLESDIRR